MDYLESLYSLKGKTAVVTGAGRGIGQTLAIGLAKAGADIAIFSRSGADETVKIISELGRKAKSYICDVIDEDSVVKTLKQVYEDFGGLDIVVNNAGICHHIDTFDAPAEDWREVLEINLTGEYIMCRAAGMLMVEHGIKGSIINIGSISARNVNYPQWQASYNASKAGVIQMTRSLAMEWAEKGYGIRVNSLSPGYMATPMALEVPQEMMDAWMPLIPLHRMADPNELMGCLLFLASDSSTYAIGGDFIVDGGYSLR